MSRFQGKVALVTGGARGIGKASCELFAREGASVVITDIREDEGEALAADLRNAGGQALYLKQDVTDEPGWDAVIGEATAKFGGLDIVVNNAGIVAVGTIEDTSFETWRQVQSVNSDSVFLGLRAAIKYMKDHGGGSIVNTSSIEGIVGNPVVMAYNASKGAVKLLTKSAALHCAQAGYNIRINSIHPGFTMTSLVTDALPMAPAGFAEKTQADIPMNRFASPEEIAKGIAFLASDDASYMTGSELVLDGGYIAR